MNKVFLAKVLILAASLATAACFIGVDAGDDLVKTFFSSVLKWALAAAAGLLVFNVVLGLINSRLDKISR